MCFRCRRNPATQKRLGFNLCDKCVIKVDTKQDRRKHLAKQTPPKIVVCCLCGRPLYGYYGAPQMPSPLDLVNHLRGEHSITNDPTMARLLREKYTFAIFDKEDHETEQATERALSPAAQRRAAREYDDYAAGAEIHEEAERIARDLREDENLRGIEL